jgi:hypothetical protein
MKNYKDLYNKYKIKYLNLKNSIGGNFNYKQNIKSSQRFLITELHLTASGEDYLELIKAEVLNFIENYNSLNSEKVPFESQYNIKGCIIPNKITVNKNITHVNNLSATGGYQLKNDKSIFDMCAISIELKLQEVVQNLNSLFISYYDETEQIRNINLHSLNYLGFFSLPFYYEKEQDENKMFYVFLLFKNQGIIEIFRPNGKYICSNTFCEYNNFFEYQLDYLKYFLTNSSVYTYKFNNLILFSHYSLEDMKQLFLRVYLSDRQKEELNIIPHLIDGVIHNYKFVSNSDFIKKHFRILKENSKREDYNKKKFITRPGTPYNNKFLDDIIGQVKLYRYLDECKSHSSLGNIKLFFKDLDTCIGLINAKISDKSKHVTREILDKHIQELKDILQERGFININHDDDIETSDNLWFKMIEQNSLVKKETIDKFFSERNTLLRAPEKQKDYTKLFKVNDIDELFKLYSLSGNDCYSMEKPLLYSNKDYTSVIEEDIRQIQPFLPDLIEKTIEYKQTPTDTIKSNVLARRMVVIAPLEHHRNEENNEFVNQTYKSVINSETQIIPDSRKFLYFPFWTKVDRDSSKLQWTLLYNKIFIQCNFKDMIFPFIIIFDNEKYPKSRYIIMKPEKLIFLGYFQIYFKTKNNNKILHTYYIFYHIEENRLEIVSEYGNEIRINQSLSDKMSLLYIEIYMIYYENKKKHFYCHPSRPGHYFFSKFTLDEIKQKIQEKFNDDKIVSLSHKEQIYIKNIVIHFFNELKEYKMKMTPTKNIYFEEI